MNIAREVGARLDDRAGRTGPPDRPVPPEQPVPPVWPERPESSRRSRRAGRPVRVETEDPSEIPARRRSGRNRTQGDRVPARALEADLGRRNSTTAGHPSDGDSPTRPDPGSAPPAVARRRVRRPTRPAAAAIGGLLWAVLLLGAGDLGGFAVALVVIPVAAVAAISGGRRAADGTGVWARWTAAAPRSTVRPSRADTTSEPGVGASSAGTGGEGSAEPPTDDGDLARAAATEAPASVQISEPAPVAPSAPRSSVPDRAAIVLAGLAAPAVLLPLVGLGGLAAVAVVGVLLAAAAAALSAAPPAIRVPVPVALATLAPAVAAASLVVARQQGSTEGLTLIAAVLLFDVSNYVMGTGTHGGILGTLAGALSVAILAFFVAAVLVPPYSGHRPGEMLGLVAVLAPAGVHLGRRVGSGALPALRRLDSLLFAGPAWIVSVAVLLHK